MDSSLCWNDSLFKIIVVLLGSSMLISCGMFGENYVKPQIATPTKWSNNEVFNPKNTNSMSRNLKVDPRFREDDKVEQVNANSALASLAWWQSFHDAELNQLIEEVLANNNDINKATINIQATEDLLRVVNDAWVPSVSGLVGNMTGNFPPLLSNETGNFAGLNVNYSLNVLKIIREKKLARLNIELQQAVLNGVRLKLISQTVVTYYELIALHDQLNLCQTEINDLTDLHQHLEKQLEMGLISQLEVNKNQEQLANLESKLPQIKTNITKLQNVLKVLLDRNPGPITVATTLADVEIKDVMPKNISSRVLEERPDIMIATYNLKIAAGKVGVAYSNLFPEFNLFLPFGVENMGGLNGTNFATTAYWLALIQGTMPFLNKATYDSITEAKSINKAEAYAYIETVRAAFADVDNGLTWQKNSAITLAKINEEKIATDKTYKLANSRYTLGSIGYADTLLYKLQLDNALGYYAEAKLSQIDSLVNLYQVLGGGYQRTDDERQKMEEFGPRSKERI